MQRGFFQRELQQPSIYPGELEEVVDQAAQVRKFVAGRGEVAAFGLRVGGDAVGEGFDQGPRRGERGAQVVGDGGNEVAPRPMIGPRYAPLPRRGP